MSNVNAKNFVLTMLIFVISLSAAAGKPNYTYTMSETPASAYSGTYVNEEITTPITQIGIPEEYLEPQVEEEGLEIAWNEWHANVRNFILDKLKKADCPGSKYIYIFIYTVDKNKSIYNITILYFPATALSGMKVIPNSEFYMYVDRTKKYYKLKLPRSSLLSVLEYELILKQAEAADEDMYKVPYAVLFAPMAEVIKKCSQNKVLTFPENSKRTSVVVDQNLTNIKELMSTRKYNATDFNDIERW